MANIYSGIYTKLKDRSTDVKDRLKLAKFAWLSDKVIFPNKEQILIDFLSGLLLNRKRNNIREDEAVLVWRCLCELLQTRKCHIPAKFKQTLIIKPSICQVLCDSILLEYEKNSGCTSDVVGCALAIIKSPSLSYVVTSKYDFLVKFLANALLLIVRTIQDGRVVLPDLVQLSQKCTAAYTVSQRAHPQQEKVFQSVVEWLLTPILLLGSLTEKFPVLKEQVEKLSSILDQAFFHKEHHPFYENFLLAVVGKNESKPKISKTTESLFQLLSNLLNKQRGQHSPTDVQKIASQYLAVFFEHFLSHMCASKNTLTGYRLFVYICGMIGIKDSSTDLLGSLSWDDVVTVLSPLMRSLLKHEIYSQPQDTEDGNVQLKFYCHVLCVVLRNKRSSFFYSCLENLLELNHAILESKLPEVLRTAWFEVPVAELETNEKTSMGSFVTKLLQTFSKLRQIPKMVSLLLTSLQESDLCHTPVLAQEVTSQLGEIVESLPQKVAIEVWELLLNNVSGFHLKLKNEDVDTSSAHKLLFVTELFAVILSRVKVADYTITHLTRLKVKDLMAATQSKCITPLIKRVTGKKSSTPEPVLFSALVLSYFWGELRLLLDEFMFNDQRSHCHQQNIYRDLEAIFTTDSKTWKSLHMAVTSVGEKRDSYLWKLLTTLVMKAILADQHKVLSSDGSLIKILVRLFSDLDTSLPEEEGLVHGMLWEISEKSYSLACVDLLLAMVPLCGAHLTPDTTQHISDLVMGIITNHTDTESRCRVQYHLLGKCHHPGLLESPTWLACMMTSAFRTLLATIQENPQNPRKKLKSENKHETVMSIIDGVSEAVFTETASDNGERLEKLQHISSLINTGLLNVDGKCQVGMNSASWMICLQQIETLAQTVQSPVEKIRGFLGILALLTAGMVQKPKIGEDAMDRMITVLIQVVEKLGQTPLFHLINVNNYINWFNWILVREKTMYSAVVYQKLELLLELSCRVMVTDFQLLPELFSIMSKALQSFSRKEIPRSVILFLKEISQLLKRSYLKEDIITLCRTGVLEIYHHLQSHMDKLPKSSKTFTVGHIQALSTMLQILPEKQIALDYVSDIYNASLKILETPQGDLILTSACLEYLESICLCRNTEVDLLSCEQKLTLWSALYKVFCNFLKENSKKSVKEDKNIAGYNLVSRILGDKAVEGEQYFTEYSFEWLSQDGGKQQSWSWTRKRMIFDGCFERDGWKLIFQQVQTVIGALIFCLDVRQFQTVIDSLVLDCSLKELTQGRAFRMLASLHLWKQAIHNELTEEKGTVVVQAAEEIMLHFQSAMILLKDIQEDALILHLAVPILNCQEDMLNFGPSLMSSQYAVLSLQSCGSIPLCTSQHYTAFHAMCGVLTSLMLHHTETVLKVIPTFISCTNHLMKFLIKMGNQEVLTDMDSVDECRNCAHLLNKLCVLIASHKLDFSKVAVYIVSNYVSEVQKVTLHPTVKRALLPAVYAILDICDNHVISQLHMVLTHGVKEVFKLLYSDYMKYHHYTGKV
ncbi:unhealthy ribosome biogenesis protein 2 homolog [Ostrea edulis]|uniref:unhealthy ribosome biogenesis protein 2 homolog n=1 Tax=Ostrea edulis TaxID=37623 RepID=UPI0024AE8AB4|nr:unhealthy ribosome biogenesis protein 2 homolog [Ostrea edulis]